MKFQNTILDLCFLFNLFKILLALFFMAVAAALLKRYCDELFLSLRDVGGGEESAFDEGSVQDRCGAETEGKG
uniref:Uncharacterized protein n=1 Tax=Romanomermis culicivorax TaxID=13658 RepID=A0A915KUN5_ROMCU